MVTNAVTVSGAVGKQVYSTVAVSGKAILKGFLLYHLSANVHVTIRDGNASGTIVVQHGSLSARNANPVVFTDEGIRFDKGMHVKVLGTNGICYLFVD